MNLDLLKVHSPHYHIITLADITYYVKRRGGIKHLLPYCDIGSLV